LWRPANTAPELVSETIWKCPSCIGWARKELCFDEKPECHFCGTPMHLETKLVQPLIRTFGHYPMNAHAKRS
jgi:hypothetical protein